MWVGGSRTSTIPTSGCSLDQGGQQFRGGGHRRDDLEAVRGQQPDQALPQQEEVFADDNAHGTSMTTMVGPPGGLFTARMPSKVASLRSTPARPVPWRGIGAARAVVGDLRPAACRPEWLRWIRTVRAPECWTALASTSATAK